MIYLNNDSFLGDKAISLPRGVFPPLPFSGGADGMVWDQTREEALVNAHEQSLSFPVSAREVTIKRGDEAESLSHQRETDFEFFLLFFSEEVTVKCWTSKHTAFWFSFFPLILLYKSTWQHVCISKYSHQKACKKTSSHFVLFMVSAKLPFTLISY